MAYHYLNLNNGICSAKALMMQMSRVCVALTISGVQHLCQVTRARGRGGASVSERKRA